MYENDISRYWDRPRTHSCFDFSEKKIRCGSCPTFFGKSSYLSSPSVPSVAARRSNRFIQARTAANLIATLFSLNRTALDDHTNLSPQRWPLSQTLCARSTAARSSQTCAGRNSSVRPFFRPEGKPQKQQVFTVRQE